MHNQGIFCKGLHGTQGVLQARDWTLIFDKDCDDNIKYQIDGDDF